MAGRNASQQGRTGFEPTSEPEANDIKTPKPAITPTDLPDTTIEYELKRAADAISRLKGNADKAREIVAAQHVPERVGSTTKPIKMLAIHTAQEIDAEILEMRRLELPLTPGEERTEAYYRLTFKKQGNAESLRKFDDTLIRTGGPPEKKTGTGVE